MPRFIKNCFLIHFITGYKRDAGAAADIAAKLAYEKVIKGAKSQAEGHISNLHELKRIPPGNENTLRTYTHPLPPIYQLIYLHFYQHRFVNTGLEGDGSEYIVLERSSIQTKFGGLCVELILHQIYFLSVPKTVKKFF